MLDAHLHLRDGDMLENVIRFSAEDVNAAIIMPNLHPNPVLSAEDAIAYYDRICEAARAEGIHDFNPLMTFKVTPQTTPAMVRQLAELPYVYAGKLYPDGVTTNSEGGVTNFFALHDVYREMEKCGLKLCIHGEMPGKKIEGLKRETAFIPIIELLAATFPKLAIVMEHITTAKSVRAVLRMPPNVAATITIHHLLLTHDDVGGDTCSPLHFCKPVLKHRPDRKALVRAAISGCPKFMSGSDSAPHRPDGKERQEDCCAGVFNSPVQRTLLIDLFERKGALEQLPLFTFENMRRFYNLPDEITRPDRVVRAVRKGWKVPELMGGVAPLKRNQVIPWSVTT